MARFERWEDAACRFVPLLEGARSAAASDAETTAPEVGDVTIVTAAAGGNRGAILSEEAGMSETAVRVVVREGAGASSVSGRDAALQMGVSGWVRNRYDGSVEALLQGPGPAVEAMLDWCRQGPPGAAVKDVETMPAERDERFAAGFSVIKDLPG